MIARWTLAELRRSRLRVLASSTAVAAAFALVVVFESIWAGEVEQVVAYIENAGADVWVMQEDVTNMHMASSFVRDTERDRVAEVGGVARADAILYMSTLVEVGERQWFSYVVGVERPDQLGGPWALAAGASSPSRGESIIPGVLARLSGARIGDSMSIAGSDLEIVGLSDETFSIANPITFVHTLDLAGILDLSGYDSYVLATADPGISAAELARRIRAEIEGVEVLTTAAFAASDRQLGRQMGVEVIALMTLIGTGLAILLVTFIVYIHTSRMQRELAVLKALGFRGRHIYAGVVIQAAVITGLGFAIAVALSLGLQALAPLVLPQLTMQVGATVVVRIGLVGLAVAILATLAPARRVATVDPMSVFSA